MGDGRRRRGRRSAPRHVLTTRLARQTKRGGAQSAAPFPFHRKERYRGQNGSFVCKNSTAVACRSVRRRKLFNAY